MSISYGSNAKSCVCDSNVPMSYGRDGKSYVWDMYTVLMSYRWDVKSYVWDRYTVAMSYGRDGKSYVCDSHTVAMSYRWDVESSWSLCSTYGRDVVSYCYLHVYNLCRSFWFTSSVVVWNVCSVAHLVLSGHFKGSTFNGKNRSIIKKVRTL